MVLLVDSSIADISKTFSWPSSLRYLTSFVSMVFLVNMQDPPDALWLLLKLLTNPKPSMHTHVYMCHYSVPIYKVTQLHIHFNRY